MSSKSSTAETADHPVLRHPEAGVHRLRSSILQAVAGSERPLQGGDVVEKFAKSGWTLTPSVKDVRHAVRWLEGHGLVEWRKAEHGPGKELHLTSAGRAAAHQGLLARSRSAQDQNGRSRTTSRPHHRGVDHRPAAGGPTAGRHLPSLVRNADVHVRCLPC